MKALELKNVTTTISNTTLLEDITFDLKAGSVKALVGHNGAGKSTLFKTILGMLEKASGKITVNENYDQDDSFLTFKQMISYLPEEPLLLTELTAMQHFQLYGMSYELSERTLTERVNRYISGFELKDKLHEYPEALSKGMRQKVQTICALLPDTPILLIDEPFIGLDVYAMDYLQEVIKQKVRNGTSILLTTHQLERVRGLADSFIMLQHGKIQNQGSISEFETIQRRTEL
ncbi:ABC transporter ATP-binding protein [Virgibacillus sp. YIM 98842]|jgi:ABC-2 type transport system ATP-binding protein|uniref:ABC transporter ATP-binding protein n=1 Tax=Virgibacillus sp. YIM 98842 TaxID=2663533 RepID=UPI0013DC6239|nr:ABC transporter ATP-binding protein [Virgibacillus sp. YIM 98842]